MQKTISGLACYFPVNRQRLGAERLLGVHSAADVSRDNANTMRISHTSFTCAERALAAADF